MHILAREGDIVQSVDDVFFDVKGLVHPPDRIVAFIRFFPDVSGERQIGETRYRKVYSLDERFRLLRERFPQYVYYDPVFDETLCGVPTSQVKKVHHPVEGLEALRKKDVLDSLESKALEFAELLKENAGIPWQSVGISGSLLIGLHRASSDIDLVVYGCKNGRGVYMSLKTLLADKRAPVKAYSLEDLKALYRFRSKDTRVDFEAFVRTEKRKILQGKFRKTDYYIRFVKDWNETDAQYGNVRYKKVGYAKIKAKITDDSGALFTPCTYEISQVKTLEGISVEPLLEIVSFRGRFCEQARKDETVTAKGKIEKVVTSETEYFRMLLGGTPDSYMKLC